MRVDQHGAGVGRTAVVRRTEHRHYGVAVVPAVASVVLWQLVGTNYLLYLGVVRQELLRLLKIEQAPGPPRVVAAAVPELRVRPHQIHPHTLQLGQARHAASQVGQRARPMVYLPYHVQGHIRDKGKPPVDHENGLSDDSAERECLEQLVEMGVCARAELVGDLVVEAAALVASVPVHVVVLVVPAVDKDAGGLRQEVHR
mmetsp:Transcript_46084/g.132037  ORF Transcript_46084/g.132037 Transcript_46084/m.132037 type:complete len:200 (+) Transcript_46084:102-701(+)